MPVEDREPRFLAIFQIAKILLAEPSLETMLSKLMGGLIDELKMIQRGMVLLYDSADDKLIVGAAQGYHLTALKRLYLTSGEAMGGLALTNDRVEVYLTSKDIRAARASLTLTNREILEAATFGLTPPQNVLCLPLITQQSRVGALVLENIRQPEALTSTELPFWEAIAELTALAIERIYQQKESQDTPTRSEANRLKAELASTLAHELRTPLTSIKGYATALLMEETLFNPETQQEFLQIIDQECDILQNIIHDLLEASIIIDEGLLEIELEPVILPRLVWNVIDDVRHRSNGHRLVVDFPSSFPIIEADSGRIGQVLHNLLDNAIKYSEEDTIIVVRGKVHQDEVVISVADQGMGIAPEHLNRLFEKFFRIKSHLRRHVVGSGLGLPIARTIVESHGGRIWAESQLGYGSTFYFSLPLTSRCWDPAEQKGQDDE